MKNIYFIISLCLTYVFYGQDNNSSFYFKQSQPAELETFKTLDKEIIGYYYKSNDSLIRIIIEKDSIYTEFGIVFVYSKKDLEKNKQLLIKDSLLFGVNEKNGVPYTINNDTLYAFLLQYDVMFRSDNNSILKKQANNYFLNYKNEYGYFSTTLLSFTENRLKLQQIDHLSCFNKIQKFENITTEKLDGKTTYIADPNSQELLFFIKDKGFNDIIDYHK